LFSTQNSKSSQTSNQQQGWDEDIFCTQILKAVSPLFSLTARGVLQESLVTEKKNKQK
jgi:hypothetical protein